MLPYAASLYALLNTIAVGNCRLMTATPAAHQRHLQRHCQIRPGLRAALGWDQQCERNQIGPVALHFSAVEVTAAKISAITVQSDCFAAVRGPFNCRHTAIDPDLIGAEREHVSHGPVERVGVIDLVATQPVIGGVDAT